MIPIGLITAASAADAAIQNRIHGCDHPSDLAKQTTILTVLNQEMKDFMKIVKSLEESGLLMKGATETIKMKQKNKNMDFLAFYQLH